MWKLYDELYTGIPSGIRVEGCVIGEKWVTVRANGNIGIARMLESPRLDGGIFIDAYLRDTACHLRWDSLTRAAVGVAALNAWYNTPERVAGLRGTGEFAYDGVEGQIIVVGDCPAFEKSGKAGAKFALPMSSDFDSFAYAAAKTADYIVVSGDALTIRALPKLLELVGENGKIILDGVSVPSSALFFAFDMPVCRINGYYRRFNYTMEAAARLGTDNIEPRMLPFSIVPEGVARIHAQENVKNFASSPYRASVFNQNRFSEWEGKHYDRSTWPEIFRN